MRGSNQTRNVIPGDAPRSHVGQFSSNAMPHQHNSQCGSKYTDMPMGNAPMMSDQYHRQPKQGSRRVSTQLVHDRFPAPGITPDEQFYQSTRAGNSMTLSLDNLSPGVQTLVGVNQVYQLVSQ